MSARVRVLIYATAPDADPGAVADAYHRVSRRLAGTPGLLGNELMRSVLDPRRYVVAAEWQDLASFQTWERGASHRGETAPLRPYQDEPGTAAFGIYEVVASYGPGPATS